MSAPTAIRQPEQALEFQPETVSHGEYSIRSANIIFKADNQ